MSIYYNKEDKLKAILNITNKLKEFTISNGSSINLYDDKYSYVEKFKDLAVKWINKERSKYEGSLYFEELDKYFNYKFPEKREEKYKFDLVENNFFK